MFCLFEVKAMGFLCFVAQILKTVTRAYHLRDKITRFGEGGFFLVLDTKPKSLYVR